MKHKKALVAGDTGICGRHLVEHLLKKNWQVCGLSRGKPSGAYSHISVDLQDATNPGEKLAEHNDITHIFYVARSPQTDPQLECDINTRMFTNLIEAIEPVAESLAHIHVMQGMKWYGSHLGHYKTPSKEDDKRHPSNNFYYAQQDWLVEQQINKAWTWSALRPHQVVGYSDQYPHNIASVIALYGSFCHARGLSFDFPGSRECFESVSMVTDAHLLAEAMEFTATQSHTENRAFNVGNGDYFRWCNLWPALADFFDVPCGDVRTHSLQDAFGTAHTEWQQLCERHSLKIKDLDYVGNFTYADFTFRAGWDDMASFNAIRDAGFNEWRDSDQLLIDTLTTYRQQKIIP